MLSLPILDGNNDNMDLATRACAGCHGDCCTVHDVPLSAFELRRLRRALGLPWNAVATVVEDRNMLARGVRLSRAPVWKRFNLRRRPSGACQFLLELEGGHRRCGVHALRPGACRIYPLLPDRTAQLGVFVSGHAICPPERAALYGEAAASLTAIVDEDTAEELLWDRMVDRWELYGASSVEGFSIETFLAWCDGILDRIDALRVGDRGQWQLSAYAMVALADWPE